MDFDAFDALTFDCYGTLIDWETGLLAALRPLVGATSDDEALLAAFARHEAALEAGPYLRYADVLAGCLRGLGAELGFVPTADEQAAFGRSVADWPAFADSPDALARSSAASGSGSSRTATTSCSRPPTAAWASSSTGSSPPSRRAATSRAPRPSSSPSSASTCRASGSCTSPRASSTTTSRPRRSA